MTSPHDCPFCAIAQSPTNDPDHPRIIAQNDHAIMIRDGFPVSPGHSLIIPKRHVGSYFKTTNDEKSCLQALLEQAKTQLDLEFSPAAYNVGINDGPAAGQTVPHCHIHLIPRYDEAGKDPRGGVRWVVAEKADYWSERS